MLPDSIDLDDKVNYLTFTPWKLYFDGSVCKDGQGVGIILVFPNGAEIGMSSRLDFYCTNNQTEGSSLIRVDHVAFHGSKTC
jgi:hypothetical protein